MKVSVIIPVYNAAPFLDKSIQSALDQKQTGEVLLIDDRSTDDSLKICKRWQGYDSRVKLFINEGTKGAGAARNVGIQHAIFDYIAFLDADDYYLDGRFDEDELLFKINHVLFAIANKVEIKTYDGKETVGLNALFCNNEAISFQMAYSIVDIYDFFRGSALHLNGLTIKRDAKLLFDDSLKQTQDTDYIYRLFLIGIVKTSDVNKTKAIYNIHNTNTITNTAEAIYYRRSAAKKHFHLALEHHLKLKLKWKFFINFMEYDYLWFCGKNHYFKKIYKIILLPFFIFRIFSKTDPEYDKNRSIQIS